MGQAVVHELRTAGQAVVVIERAPAAVEELQEAGVPVVAGDATSPAVLERAGVQRARGLVACLDDDAHNVYAVLTARSLSTTLTIVARASGEGAEDRLRRAGADRVVNPYQIGGIRLAHLLEKPAVVDFLDLSRVGAGRERSHLMELPVAATALVGRSIADVTTKGSLSVVAMIRDAEFTPNPEGDVRLVDNDVLIVLGTPDALADLERSKR
jgi:voltage-gated potassium channel